MVRVILMIIPDISMPKTIDGIMNCPRFPSGSSVKLINFIGGDHPHQSEGKTTTSVASQKLGIAIASSHYFSISYYCPTNSCFKSLLIQARAKIPPTELLVQFRVSHLRCIIKRSRAYVSIYE